MTHPIIVKRNISRIYLNDLRSHECIGSNSSNKTLKGPFCTDYQRLNNEINDTH